MPRYRLRLAGAQVPTELVASWLRGARHVRFDVEYSSLPVASRNGFGDLVAGRCDLACTDRSITRSERSELGQRRVRGWRVAFCGFALYVHPDNPLDSLFAGDIGPIFGRRVTDWSQLLGGSDPPLRGPIRIIGPPKGTRGGEVLARRVGIWMDDPAWEVMRHDAQIAEAVAADPHALGFAAIGFDPPARYVGLRMERDGPAVLPSREDIEQERYGLAQVVFLYHEDPPREAVRAVLDYLYGPHGQRAICSSGFWPVPRQRAEVSAGP